MNFILIGMLMQGVVHMTVASAEPALSPPIEAAVHPEASPFDEKAEAADELAGALARAGLNRKNVILVLGANWCHDSRALAGWFATARFGAMLAAKYEIVYVDIGSPQTKQGRNLDIAKQHGLGKLRSTPAVVMLAPDGRKLNSKKDALGWRNAASRSEQAIFDYFDGFTPA